MIFSALSFCRISLDFSLIILSQENRCAFYNFVVAHLFSRLKICNKLCLWLTRKGRKPKNIVLQISQNVIYDTHII